ncbi:hypothetical protein C482_00065 [Natrialba chahannaoensis JCM 10990]|uniref:DUF262 domain-containing protein n=1 Tax=Natrialba chahannaoensis JCM 10990 TaxID=1227492 RepID=M0B943_9EURY|nr:DUF262 domain-containing protein [Natrialba chahannaoensis]ELZ06169.1 hypothetical protein C482_00065 [Natrialba chahannaoensis JCM 10990]
MIYFTPQSKSVADLVERLAADENDSTKTELDNPIYIPSLQREFCWSHTQIEKLFDSLLRGLPLGSLLLWKVSGSTAADEASYKFIKHYAEESAYPTQKKYEKDDRYVRNKSKQLTNSDKIPDQYTFALDGQQRLTSFLIGLRGTHYRYKGQKYRTKLHSYTERKLYLNLLSYPSEYDTTESDLRYEFKFRTSGGQRTSAGNFWWPVTKLWELDNINTEINNLQAEVAESPQEEHAIESNLSRLYEAIYEDDHLVIEHVTEMESEIALHLFVRRNDGGESLSNSDIAFSQMSVYWTLEDDDPKEAIESYVDDLEADWGTYGFGFSKGFIIRSLLMLTGDTSPSFRREYLIPNNIEKLEDIWVDEAYKQAMSEAFRLVTDELGLGRKCLTSNNAMLPILYYCYLTLTDTDRSCVNPSKEILDRMEYWLSVTVCNNLFTLGSDTVLRRAQDYITEDSFPVLDIVGEFEGRGIQLKLTEDRLETLVEETDYHSGSVKHFLLTRATQDSRISGELVEVGDNATSQIQVDHIYPQNKLNPDEDSELEKRDLESTDQDNRHQLGNLQLIPENQSKGDTDPADWLQEVSTDRKGLETLAEIHCLPWLVSKRYTYDRFGEFWNEREDLLLDRLKSELTLYDDLATDTVPVMN